MNEVLSNRILKTKHIQNKPKHADEWWSNEEWLMADNSWFMIHSDIFDDDDDDESWWWFIIHGDIISWIIADGWWLIRLIVKLPTSQVLLLLASALLKGIVASRTWHVPPLRFAKADLGRAWRQWPPWRWALMALRVGLGGQEGSHGVY